MFNPGSLHSDQREEGKSFAIVTADLRKAFDSVSHWSLRRALLRHRIAPPLIAYIMYILSGSSTITQVGNKIHIARGVQQADPLRPLLLNLAIDELLIKLEMKKCIRGILFPGIKVPAKAFVSSLAEQCIKKTSPLNIPHKVPSFYKASGIVINPKQSMAMVAVANNKRICIRKPNNLFLDVYLFKDVGIADSFKYHSQEFCGTGDMRPSDANLATLLLRVDRAALKPDQKALVIIRNIVVPKALYGLQSAKVNSKILREADRLLKYRYQSVLHLSIHTPDQFLYASDGAPGLTQLRHAFPTIMHTRVIRLRSIGHYL
nr:unnamed protein product [Callosobruchus analis]